MLTIPFEKSDETGVYILRDALVLPDDHSFTDVELEVIKQQRFDEWYSIAVAPIMEA